MNREDPFDGAWKLNPEKSNFDPNHRTSSATMRWECTSDGYTMTAEGIAGDGSVAREKPATFVPDGKDHEIPGVPGFTAAVSRLSPNVLEVESKNVGGIVGQSQLCRVGRWRNADHECFEHRRAAAPLQDHARLGTLARP